MLTQLKNLAAEYAQTANGSWLNDFDWDSVPVRFKDLKHSVVGYHFLGTVAPMKVVDARLIFDIYIHELQHVWQWKKHPVRYLIEKDADAEEKKALDCYCNNK